MASQMKVVVIRGPGDFQLEWVNVPPCPDKGLLIKVLACGLCGSDLRTLRSGHRNITFPWIIGHEIAGEVVRTGTRYQGRWRTGDRLAVAPMVYCGNCDFCELGQYELCDHAREIAQHWPGGFAEYLAIPEEALNHGTIQPIPEGLEPCFATVSEPAASCIHAQEKGMIGLGDSVAIIGSGPIGCIHIAVARARGANPIIIADIQESRLRMCAPFSPDATVDAAAEDLVDRVMKLTSGKGADVVITANPAGETQGQALEMVRKGGRVIFFGGLPHNSSKPGIDTNLIHYKGLHVLGATTFAPRHQKLAISMLASGSIPGEKLVTQILPLEQFAAGVALASEGKALKVVFVP